VFLVVAQSRKCTDGEGMVRRWCSEKELELDNVTPKSGGRLLSMNVLETGQIAKVQVSAIVYYDQRFGIQRWETVGSKSMSKFAAGHASNGTRVRTRIIGCRPLVLQKRKI
jgi:hypothetical protein